jgi:hypothetical protein
MEIMTQLPRCESAASAILSQSFDGLRDAWPMPAAGERAGFDTAPSANAVRGGFRKGTGKSYGLDGFFRLDFEQRRWQSEHANHFLDVMMGTNSEVPS